MSRSRRRLAALALLLLGIGLVAGLRAWSRSDEPRFARTLSNPGRGAGPRLAGPAPGRSVVPPATARLIDDVTVDRSPVCTQEPAIIRIAAHDPTAADPRLQVEIVGEGEGDVVAIRRGHPGDFQARVRATADDGRTDERSVSWSVRDCPGRGWVAITWRPASNDDELIFEVLAHPGDGGETLPDGTRYHWTFGDGTEADGPLRIIEHSYFERPRDRASRSFVIQVEVRGPGMQPLSGTTTTTLVDDYFLHARRGLLFLPVRIASSVLRDDQVVATLDVLDPESSSIELDALEVAPFPCGAAPLPDPSALPDSTSGDGGTPPEVPGAGPPRALHPLRAGLELLSMRSLGPGRNRLELRIPAAQIGAGDCGVRLVARGRSARGVPTYFTCNLAVTPGASDRPLRPPAVAPTPLFDELSRRLGAVAP